MRFIAIVVLWFSASLLAPIAVAQTPPDAGAPKATTKEQRETELDAAVSAAQAAAVKGPTDIKLADKGVLHLPDGMNWIPQAQAQRYQRANGHEDDPELLGIISGGTEAHGWIAIVRYTSDGHVKDDEAKDLDAAKILENLRSSQAEANEDRTARGFEPLTLDDWLQPPAYDEGHKWLVWGLPVHGPDDASHPTINYNTRVLSREGYLTLNLLTDKDHFAADKGEATKLLNAISYNPGHRYVDFNPSTDKVAAYGLAALIGAVALKKLGLIAIATAFVLKFAKLGFIALIGIFAAVKRFVFGRKKEGPAD